MGWYSIIPDELIGPAIMTSDEILCANTPTDDRLMRQRLCSASRDLTVLLA